MKLDICPIVILPILMTAGSLTAIAPLSAQAGSLSYQSQTYNFDGDGDFSISLPQFQASLGKLNKQPFLYSVPPVVI